jgi:hypothetical protein
MPHAHGTTDRHATVRDTRARGTYVTLSVTARARAEIQTTFHFSVMPRVVAVLLDSDEHPRLRIVSMRACPTTAASAA